MCLTLPSIPPDCAVVAYGHGLCVPAADRASAEADSELVTVPSGRWCAGGMSVFTYVRVNVCVYVSGMWLFQVSAASWKRLSELSKSPNKCVCGG